MCCCDKPTINGEPGYRWQPNDEPTVRATYPPDLDKDDKLLYDEPGRCGGLDAHSHHFRLVRHYGWVDLLVMHGAGQQRFHVTAGRTLLDAFAAMDTHTRYWTFFALHNAHNLGAHDARTTERLRWKKAAADKRIRTQKVRNQPSVKVWIEGEA